MPSIIRQEMSALLHTILSREAAAAHVDHRTSWAPTVEPRLLLNGWSDTPTAAYLRERPDLVSNLRSWLSMVVSTHQGSPGQCALMALKAPAASASLNWWHRLVPLLLHMEDEHSCMCAGLWFEHMDRPGDTWVQRGVAPLVFPAAPATPPSSWCLLTVAYELLGSLVHPYAPALLQAFLLRVPMRGTPQAMAGHWPKAEVQRFRFARHPIEEMAPADLDIASTDVKTEAETEALNVLKQAHEKARQSQAAQRVRAFQETVNATDTPLVVYDCVYLQTFLAPRDTWLPHPSTTTGLVSSGSFVLPLSSSVAPRAQ
jgi:hypothetical protein